VLVTKLKSSHVFSLIFQKLKLQSIHDPYLSDFVSCILQNIYTVTALTSDCFSLKLAHGRFAIRKLFLINLSFRNTALSVYLLTTFVSTSLYVTEYFTVY
jgi:hypothetical protein